MPFTLEGGGRQWVWMRRQWFLSTPTPPFCCCSYPCPSPLRGEGDSGSGCADSDFYLPPLPLSAVVPLNALHPWGGKETVGLDAQTVIFICPGSPFLLLFPSMPFTLEGGRRQWVWMRRQWFLSAPAPPFCCCSPPCPSPLRGEGDSGSGCVDSDFYLPPLPLFAVVPLHALHPWGGKETVGLDAQTVIFICPLSPFLLLFPSMPFTLEEERRQWVWMRRQWFLSAPAPPFCCCSPPCPSPLREEGDSGSGCADSDFYLLPLPLFAVVPIHALHLWGRKETVGLDAQTVIFIYSHSPFLLLFLSMPFTLEGGRRQWVWMRRQWFLSAPAAPFCCCSPLYPSPLRGEGDSGSGCADSDFYLPPLPLSAVVPLNALHPWGGKETVGLDAQTVIFICPRSPF